MFNRIHSYNDYLIHVIYFVLCSVVEPMTIQSWQLCKQACYQVGYSCTLVGYGIPLICVRTGVVVGAGVCFSSHP